MCIGFHACMVQGSVALRAQCILKFLAMASFGRGGSAEGGGPPADDAIEDWNDEEEMNADTDRPEKRARLEERMDEVSRRLTNIESILINMQNTAKPGPSTPPIPVATASSSARQVMVSAPCTPPGAFAPNSMATTGPLGQVGFAGLFHGLRGSVSSPLLGCVASRVPESVKAKAKTSVMYDQAKGQDMWRAFPKTSSMSRSAGEGD